MIERELLAFIHSSIRSVWTLELLLCLRRSGDKVWSRDELVRDMRASDLIVTEGLSTLTAAGLVRPASDGYRYTPASPALAQLVEQLETLYRDRPVALTNAVLSAPNDRLRTFADAFRFKRDR